jgi:hypothetical protein
MGTEKNKFNEDLVLHKVKAYIDNTYNQHYGKGNIQTTEVTFDSGHGESFCIGNILKYAQRFGKKEQGASDNQIKDLPMTPSKKKLESKSPFFKYWNKNKPNPKRTKRSITYEERGDFNEQYGLNPLMVGATT